MTKYKLVQLEGAVSTPVLDLVERWVGRLDLVFELDCFFCLFFMFDKQCLFIGVGVVLVGVLYVDKHE